MTARPNFTAQEYLHLRAPRYGRANPEKIENPVWDYVIRNNLSGYGGRNMLAATLLQSVSEQIGSTKGELQYPGYSAYRERGGPHWSWERFGRSATAMPDGRTIFVAGEHEDAYDCDFCIYNDVVVAHPNGEIDIYLYPKEVFPPTDFHSATLRGDDIYLIGSVGYMDLRKPGPTQLFKLSTQSFIMERLTATGDDPGWIALHKAFSSEDEIICIAGGRVLTEDNTFTTNSSAFELDLNKLHWRAL